MNNTEIADMSEYQNLFMTLKTVGELDIFKGHILGNNLLSN